MMGTLGKYLCLIAVMAALWGCNKKPASKREPAAKPATVQNAVKEADLTTITLTSEAESRLGIATAAVESRPVDRVRTFGGEVVPVSGRSVTVSAPLAGTLLAVDGGSALAAGKQVTKDRPLYRLLLALPEQDLLSVQEAISLGKIEYDLAQAKVKRAQQLREDKAGSIRELEDAQAQLAVAQASLETARARLELLKKGDLDTAAEGLSALTIKSPVEGVIQEVYVAPGQTVTGATPLLSILGVDPVWIRVPVYVGDVQTIDSKKPARVHSLADLTAAEARTAQPVAAPFRADPASVTADLFYELPNADLSYRPGQRVGVTVALTATAPSLVVPYSAVVYDMYGGAWVYQSTGPHVYARQRVELHHVLGDLAVLSRGPAAGAKVVGAGAAELFGTEFGVGK
ncbi:MAG: efflux RND transporter periplasmic adaptor subunit [Planctomycetes bacterium]|jgi:RND family efflux transporter MFP subunit|nr:efflux RND transporter periplasmic adaptor subunit [Planctomycetota bacterium]